MFIPLCRSVCSWWCHSRPDERFCCAVRSRCPVDIIRRRPPANLYGPRDNTTIGVPDMGIDVIGAQDDQILLFYNRAPSTFGADRYSLTNPADDEATFVGAEMITRLAPAFR